jgi:hypothetical protein
MVCAAHIAAAITLALANLAPLAPPAPAPVATVFAHTAGALTTLLANEHVLEYANVFFRSYRALPTAYLLDNPNVPVLVSELQPRNTKSSWGNLLDVIVINTVNCKQDYTTLKHNLLTSYGPATLIKMHMHVEPRLYQFLTESVPADLKSVDCHSPEIIQTDRWSHRASVNKLMMNAKAVADTCATTARDNLGGLDAYRAPLNSSDIIFTEANTRVTTTHAHDNLGGLDAYMAPLHGSDIKVFNPGVCCQLPTVMAHGKATHKVNNTDDPTTIMALPARIKRPEERRHHGCGNTARKGVTPEDGKASSKMVCQFHFAEAATALANAKGTEANEPVNRKRPIQTEMKESADGQRWNWCASNATTTWLTGATTGFNPVTTCTRHSGQMMDLLEPSNEVPVMFCPQSASGHTNEGALTTNKGVPFPTSATTNIHVAPCTCTACQYGKTCRECRVSQCAACKAVCRIPQCDACHHDKTCKEPKQGILPKQLANCRVPQRATCQAVCHVPQCDACHFGMVSKTSLQANCPVPQCNASLAISCHHGILPMQLANYRVPQVAAFQVACRKPQCMSCLHGKAFKVPQSMAKQGILSKLLAICRVFQCAAACHAFVHEGGALIIQQGILPMQLANCRTLQCAAFQHGNASKGSWRVEQAPMDGGLFFAATAGQVVNQNHPPKQLATFCVTQGAACWVISRVPQCDACHSGKASVVVNCKQAFAVTHCHKQCLLPKQRVNICVPQGTAYQVICRVPQCDASHSNTVSKTLAKCCIPQGVACQDISCVPQCTASTAPCCNSRDSPLFQATMASHMPHEHTQQPHEQHNKQTQPHGQHIRHCLAHEPSRHLQQMAKTRHPATATGNLPRASAHRMSARLSRPVQRKPLWHSLQAPHQASCHVPQCAACHYGKDPKYGKLSQAAMARHVVCHVPQSIACHDGKASKAPKQMENQDFCVPQCAACWVVCCLVNCRVPPCAPCLVICFKQGIQPKQLANYCIHQCATCQVTCCILQCAAGHVATTVLDHGIRQGILSQRCAACQHGNASKVLWHVQGTSKDCGLFQATRASEIVNKIQVTVLCLVGQIKGWLTAQRCDVATIVVDHNSRLPGVVFLSKSETVEDALAAKQAFEGRACTIVAKALRFHAADNSRMKDANQRRTVSVCRVNTHSRSGVTERSIRKLQDGTLPAKHHPHMGTTIVSAKMWPDALWHCKEVMACPKLTHVPSSGCPACAACQVASRKPQSSGCRMPPVWQVIQGSTINGQTRRPAKASGQLQLFAVRRRPYHDHHCQPRKSTRRPVRRMPTWQRRQSALARQRGFHGRWIVSRKADSSPALQSS